MTETGSIKQYKTRNLDLTYTDLANIHAWYLSMHSHSATGIPSAASQRYPKSGNVKRKDTI
jgi:hypothetical protein